MNKLILCYLLILTATLTVIGNCGSDEAYEWYIQAQVKIVTLTSEDSFSFYERCNIHTDEIDQDIRWVIEADDKSVPFGIAISWKESFITGPGTFQVEGDSNLLPMIGRAHPTEPGWFTYYFIDEGIITFTQLGYQSGDIIEGTFDQFYVYDWEVEEYIEVNDGSFRCQVE